MIVAHERDIKSKRIDKEGVKEMGMKAIIGPKEGWNSHVMRVFDVGPGGHTPLHRHPWPHINYVLEGKGVLHYKGEDHQLEPGSYAFVDAGKQHQYRNAGDETFRFICIVPKEGHK